MPVDVAPQYVTYLSYFKDIILGNNSIFYSLEKSIGGDMYGLFAYYLTSPYNLITLFFENSNMPLAFDIILALKTASTSVTFCYFLNRRKNAKFTNLIFSFCYAMSSYAITYGFNIMWLDSMILLPLVVAGIDDLLTLNKNILYTGTLSLTLITNYYTGFMVCIFSSIYFLYKLLSEPKGVTIKEYLLELMKKIKKFAIYSIIAVLIASIILIPVFIGLQNGRADFTFEDLEFDENFEWQDGLSKFFTNSFVLNDIGTSGMPPIFCGVIINLLVLLYFTNAKIKLKEKIFSFLVLSIFVASFYLNGINLLWTMGNFPACYLYRYAFCFAFMYILLAHKSFENIKGGVKVWGIILAIIVYQVVGFSVLKFNLGDGSKTWIRIDMCLAVVFSLLIFIYKLNLTTNAKTLIGTFLKKHYLKIVSTLLILINIVNMTINTADGMKILMIYTSRITYDNYLHAMKFYKQEFEKIRNNDDGIYRIEQRKRIDSNDSFSFRFYGVNSSTSTFSKELYGFLRNIGYSQQHVSIVSDTGNTKAIHMLLGIKYIINGVDGINIEDYDLQRQNDILNVYKNPYALSLGFSVPKSVINNVDIEYKNAFNYQNKILKNLTNLNDDIFIEHKGVSKKSKDYIYINEDNTKTKYEFIAEQNNDVYMYLLRL